MSQIDQEKAFVSRLKQSLDQRLDKLDDETTTQLYAARQKALRSLPQSRPRWLAVGGWSAAAVSLLLVMVLWNTDGQSPDSPGFIEDLELLSTNEDIEFIEDLDFYLWLDDEQQVV